MSSNTSSTPTRKGNAGSFRKGADPRRHRFTAEECSRGGQIGFWVALAVYVERGGNPRNFLRNKFRARGQEFTPRQGRRAAR